MNENNMPLSLMMENAKGAMTDAFNQIVEQSNLPAYLLEGIVADLLSEIRKQKNLELISDMNRMKQTEHSEQEEKKENRLPESLGRLPKAGKKPVIDHARSYKEFIGDRPPLPGREALPRWEWDRCLAAGNSRQWRP